MRNKVTIALSLGFLVGAAYYASEPYETMPVFRVQALHAQIKKTDAVENAPLAVRFEYPMVIGGIHNGNVLCRVAALYDVDCKDAQFTVVKEGFYAFVSYRKDNRTYWTKKPRYIKAGTKIIVVDGRVLLEACGNELSFIEVQTSERYLPQNTLVDEPDDVYPPINPDDPAAPTNLVAQVLPIGVLPSLPLTNPPMMGSSYEIGPIIGGVYAPVPHTPSVSVDEPSSLVMLAYGLIALIGVKRRKRWAK